MNQINWGKKTNTPLQSRLWALEQCQFAVDCKMGCIIYSANSFQVVIGRPVAGEFLPGFITVHNSSSLGGAVCTLHQEACFSMATTGSFCYVCRWHDVLEKKSQQFCNLIGSVHHSMPWQECQHVSLMLVRHLKVFCTTLQHFIGERDAGPNQHVQYL